jgi:hypothetical protein
MSLQEVAIVRSVVYASLFDYPLTLEQLHRTLIAFAQTPSQILATYRSSVAVQSVVGCGKRAARRFSNAIACCCASSARSLSRAWSRSRAALRT